MNNVSDEKKGGKDMDFSLYVCFLTYYFFVTELVIILLV